MKYKWRKYWQLLEPYAIMGVIIVVMFSIYRIKKYFDDSYWEAEARIVNRTLDAYERQRVEEAIHAFDRH